MRVTLIPGVARLLNVVIPPEALDTPVITAIAATSLTQVDVTYSTVDGATRYVLEVTRSVDDDYQTAVDDPVTGEDGATRTGTVSGLASDVFYDVRVYAIDATTSPPRISSPSNSVQFIVEPTPVSATAALSSSDHDDATFRLDVDPPRPAALYIRPLGTGEFVLRRSETNELPVHVQGPITGLTPSTAYEWYFDDPIGGSYRTDTQTFTTDHAPSTVTATLSEEEVTQNSLRLRVALNEALSLRGEYRVAGQSEWQPGRSEPNPYKTHRMLFDSLSPGVTYELRVFAPLDGAAVGGIYTVTTLSAGNTGGETPTGSGVTGSATFAEIAAAGLDQAAYPTDDHYLAEYLYQNPEVRYAQVTGDTVETLAVPEPGAATQLPQPSGGDDTAMIREAIRANTGGEIVGNPSGGRYRVSGLAIDRPISMWDVPMTAGSGTCLTVATSDVRIYGSVIKGSSSSGTYGVYLLDGADRFHWINSGLIDQHNRNGVTFSGIRFRGGADYHIAGCRFDNLLNSAAETETGRANALYYHPSKKAPSRGGNIWNNTSENLQSTGSRDDAEFFTIQDCSGTDTGTIRIFGNRTNHAGKRFIKHMAGRALVLSNLQRWTDYDGPLDRRKMNCFLSVQQAGNNVTMQHNRMRYAAEGAFDGIARISPTPGYRFSGINIDRNDVELIGPYRDYNSYGIDCIGKSGADGTNIELRGGSTCTDNVVRASGGATIINFFIFRNGFSSGDAGFDDVSGNVVQAGALTGAFKGA